MYKMKYVLLLASVMFALVTVAQEPAKWQGKFEQLDQVLPTPNE
jgi:hypothetical protein